MIHVAAVGDIMLCDSAQTVGFGTWSRYRRDAMSAVFAELAPKLRSADLAIGNLECPLAPEGVGASRWARDQMRGDREYAQVLRDAGFTAIAVANNHAVQHGEEAFHATVEALRAAGLLVLGLRGSGAWHGEPVTHTAADGSTVAILAYSWRPRQYGHGPPPYADVQEEAVLADVARARASHHSVVVSLHWGVEFVNLPSVAEMEFAHRLAERGADVVLGHHPHIVRPVERVGNAVIAYSLGNCVTDMLWLDYLRAGLVLELDLAPQPANVRVTTTRVDAEYRVRLQSTISDMASHVAALDAATYEATARAELGAQRTASYAYLARNAFRFPPAVLATLVGKTVGNKLSAALGRAKARGR